MKQKNNKQKQVERDVSVGSDYKVIEPGKTHIKKTNLAEAYKVFF